jgi:hypothetical protein
MVGTLGIAMAMAVGCSSHEKVQAPPPSKKSTTAAPAGTKAAPSISPMQQFRNDLVAGEQQIDATLKSLNTLSDPKTTDLRAAYDDFTNQLARTNDAADTIKREANAMRTARDQYFANWEEKVTEIDNPTIRASAEARRARMRDAQERIVSKSMAVRDSYEPFMKDLQDVKKYLGPDLSKDSIADIGDAVKKVQTDGTIVKQKIDAVVAELDAVQGK